MCRRKAGWIVPTEKQALLIAGSGRALGSGSEPPAASLALPCPEALPGPFAPLPLPSFIPRRPAEPSIELLGGFSQMPWDSGLRRSGAGCGTPCAWEARREGPDTHQQDGASPSREPGALGTESKAQGARERLGRV